MLASGDILYNHGHYEKDDVPGRKTTCSRLCNIVVCGCVWCMCGMCVLKNGWMWRGASEGYVLLHLYMLTFGDILYNRGHFEKR